jgi:transposase
VHAADIQDRDGGVLLMSTMFGLFPFLLKLYADGGYQGPKFREGLQRVCGQINVEIVKRSDVSKFIVLPKRWIVERTIAWLNRCRRLAKDWECLNRNALAFLVSIRKEVMRFQRTLDRPLLRFFQRCGCFGSFRVGKLYKPLILLM